jgi:hypothetical protein
MNNEISTLGWVLIIGLALFILALNLGLFVGLGRKMKDGNWVDKMASAGKVLKDPYKKDNDQFNQLSQEVEKFKKQDKE